MECSRGHEFNYEIYRYIASQKRKVLQAVFRGIFEMRGRISLILQRRKVGIAGAYQEELHQGVEYEGSRNY
jgi:hypothetical protein